MSDFRAKYKQKGLSFGNPERSRITRADERDERRKEIRAQNFSKLRPLVEIEKTGTPGPSADSISRNEKLKKWKQEKEMKKKTEKKVFKPPFKVGVVHHRVFSPINDSSGPTCLRSHSHSNIKSRIKQPAPIKGITRVTEKRLAAKAAAQAAAAKAAAKKSFAPPNYKFKAPAGLPNIPLFGRVKKGSIDATKFSWNLNTEKGTAIKSDARDSFSSQRRKSNSIVRESSRRSKKFRTSYKEDDSMNLNSLKEELPCLSGSDKRRTSNSSTDSTSLRASSDDAEVSDSPIAEPSHINVDMKKKELTLKEVIVNSSISNDHRQISPLKGKKKSTAKLRFPSPTKKNLETSLEEINDPILEVNALQEDRKAEVNSFEKTDETPEIHPETELENMDCSLLESEDKILDDSMNPAFFSPYVVTRRGKKEARKEQQLRRGLGQSPEEIPTKDTIMQSLNISIEEEKRTSQYFRCLMKREMNRLQELCDIWTKLVSTENPPEEALYIVQQAVGQTKLLLAKKFKRFEGLVLDCEKGNGQMLVTCKDLQGFWDIVYMEIKNCEDRFRKLEELKSRGWVEEEEVQKPVPKKLVKKKSPKKKSPKKSPKKAAVKSSLRAMILAARQKKKEIEENQEGKPGDQEVMDIWKNVVRDSPTKVTSAKRNSSNTPQRLTPKDRGTSFPLAVMAISQKWKTPDNKAPGSKISLETQVESEMETDDDVEDEISKVQVRLDESISYINSRQTPGKSILKRVKVESTSDGSDDSRMKSTQKVIFNDKVELKEVEVDEEAGTTASLAAALARIDSLEFDSEFVPEMKIRAERKLNFEDESFNEVLNASAKEDAVFNAEEPVYETLVPKFKLIPPTPKSPRVRKSKKFENSILEGTTFEESIVEDKENMFTKSLRNRTVIGSLTPRSSGKFKDIYNSSNSGKSPKIQRKNSTVGNNKPEENNENLNLNNSLKRSSRSSKRSLKSPRFSGKSPRWKPKKQASSPLKENQDNHECQNAQ